MEFKDRLKQVMKDERWNSKQLAEATGLCPATISHFINGRRKPSLDNFKKIHNVLLGYNHLLDYKTAL